MMDDKILERNKKDFKVDVAASIEKKIIYINYFDSSDCCSSSEQIAISRAAAAELIEELSYFLSRKERVEIGSSFLYTDKENSFLISKEDWDEFLA